VISSWLKQGVGGVSPAGISGSYLVCRMRSPHTDTRRQSSQRPRYKTGASEAEKKRIKESENSGRKRGFYRVKERASPVLFVPPFPIFFLLAAALSRPCLLSCVGVACLCI